MATMQRPLGIVQPAEGDLHALGALRRALESRDHNQLASTRVPDSAYQAMLLAVEYLSRNQAVSIEPYSEYLTTQRVADLLKVSRPTVIELVKRGELGQPVERTVGGHRRLRLADVIAYRARQRERWTDVDLAGESERSGTQLGGGR